MVVVAWLRAAERLRLTCGYGHAQQLRRVQIAGAVLGALRGAKLRPQPRQRPRGHWPAQQRGSLAQARIFLVPPDADLAACFFDRSLLAKGMQLLHRIRGTDLSVADTEAVPQAGSNGPLHRFIATRVALGGVEREMANWVGTGNLQSPRSLGDAAFGPTKRQTGAAVPLIAVVALSHGISGVVR